LFLEVVAEGPVRERETESARREVAATGREVETEKGSTARGAGKEIVITRQNLARPPLDHTEIGTETETEKGSVNTAAGDIDIMVRTR
jgi:hypothetical protein